MEESSRALNTAELVKLQGLGVVSWAVSFSLYSFLYPTTNEVEESAERYWSFS